MRIKSLWGMIYVSLCLFFLIGCQDDRLHLHVLARLCMLSKQPKVLLQLRAAESANAVVTVLHRAEEEIVGQM